MPELPDVSVYVAALERFLDGKRLHALHVISPSLLRSVDPPLRAAQGKNFVSARRIGKRIALELEDDLFLVIHLMIAGRLRWRPPGTKLARKGGLASFEWNQSPNDAPFGTLIFTEASTKKRATLHLVRGEAALAEHDRGGLEVLESSFEAFRERLLARNHTLKRALSDPTLFSGIGNAYSDEILHCARLSPIKLTSKLEEAEVARLFAAIRETLETWTQKLLEQVGDGFPEKVTAFRPGMAAHGRYGKPCPVCEAPIQRIVYASNETNYCAPCQTGGKLLADRALSRLLKKDWPKSLDELEAHMLERSAD